VRIRQQIEGQETKGGLLPLPFAVCLLPFALTGCGGPVDVQGKVTLNGKPLAGAMVVFIPEGGGPEAGAFTDAEGNFRLNGRKTEGTLPGEYRVIVSKKEWPPGVTPPDPTKMTFDSVKAKRETVPANYTVQDRTPLRVTVPRGGTTDVHLILEK
jgi:Carboxypeptidase regulatory-like domain